MSRTPKTDLADFRLYLQDVPGVQASITTYCSMVRRVLREVVPLDEPNLTFFFYDKLNANTRANVRAAWMHYVNFCRSVRSEDVPVPGYKTHASPPKNVYADVVTLPEEVLDVVFRLTYLRKWTLATFYEGTWGKVLAQTPARMGDSVLLLPLGKVTHWLAFERELAILRKWGWGDSTPPPAAPLLPRSPGSMSPYPSAMLQVALKNLQVRPDHIQPFPEESSIPAVASKPAPHEQEPVAAIADEVGKPVSTEELESILKSSRMPSPPDRPQGDFFFMVDLRQAAPRALPAGLRSREDIEADRAAAPPRTSALGGAVHRKLDHEIELLEAWERGESIDDAETETHFRFDTNED